jgi:hypothetical protein
MKNIFVNLKGEKTMDDLILFAVIVGVAILLLIDYLVSKTFREIAIMKGHSEIKYFWFCFFLGVAGYLMVVALPTNATVPVEVSTKIELPVDDELPEI